MVKRTQSNRISGNANWLIKLRWVAVIGQLVTVLATRLLFPIEPPALLVILFILLLTAGSNVFLKIWFARWQSFAQQDLLPWDLVLGLILVMDMLSLTVLLFVTGGPNNPFFLFFFVNVSLCALVLNRRWAWAINGLTILCFAGLMFEHLDLYPLSFGLEKISSAGSVTIQQIGLMIAFATCSSVIVYFMTRLTDELRENQARMRLAEAQQARAEKMDALGTLAAGTAHELATPLSTIAIVAKEVEQAFNEHPPEFPGAEEVLEDVRLIRSQLERCRKIIDRMASHAGEAIGESILPVTIDQLTRATLEGLIGRERVDLLIDPETAQQQVSVPLHGLSQAMRGLVQNALDADPSDQPVQVIVDQDKEWFRWKVIDRGPGMDEQHLKRISEPFFTTKPPGKGMGLGVFLAQNVIQRLGGSITFESSRGKGTSVAIQLPRN
jgi:two-component system sensor histidine kinase RegB